jgi:hypothetical protein
MKYKRVGEIEMMKWLTHKKAIEQNGIGPKASSQSGRMTKGQVDKMVNWPDANLKK